VTPSSLSRLSLYSVFLSIDCSVRTLLNVDMNQIIMKKAGEEKANKINEMFKLFGGQWAKVSPLPALTLILSPVSSLDPPI
jgi:hypothetical protein